MRGSQVCDNRSIPNSLPTHPSLPNPLLGALSPLPSLSLPGRNGHRWPGAPEGLCSSFGAMLSFQILVRAKPQECSDLPKKCKKRGRQSMFWVSSDLGLFPTPQLPAEGARRGGRRPRSLRQSRGQTPLHKAAYKGHAECVDLLLKAGAEKARPPSSQGGFSSKFQGPGGRRKM